MRGMLLLHLHHWMLRHRRLLTTRIRTHSRRWISCHALWLPFSAGDGCPFFAGETRFRGWRVSSVEVSGVQLVGDR